MKSITSGIQAAEWVLSGILFRRSITMTKKGNRCVMAGLDELRQRPYKFPYNISRSLNLEN